MVQKKSAESLSQVYEKQMFTVTSVQNIYWKGLYLLKKFQFETVIYRLRDNPCHLKMIIWLSRHDALFILNLDGLTSNFFLSIEFNSILGWSQIFYWWPDTWLKLDNSSTPKLTPLLTLSKNFRIGKKDF